MRIQLLWYGSTGRAAVNDFCGVDDDDDELCCESEKNKLNVSGEAIAERILDHKCLKYMADDVQMQA